MLVGAAIFIPLARANLSKHFAIWPSNIFPMWVYTCESLIVVTILPTATPNGFYQGEYTLQLGSIPRAPVWEPLLGVLVYRKECQGLTVTVYLSGSQVWGGQPVYPQEPDDACIFPDGRACPSGPWSRRRRFVYIWKTGGEGLPALACHLHLDLPLPT